MIVRRTFYWVSKVIRNFLSIVLPPSVAGPANTGHFSNRSDSKLKKTNLDLLTSFFSRSRRLTCFYFNSRYDHFLLMSVFVVMSLVSGLRRSIQTPSRFKLVGLVGIMLPAPRILFQSFGGELKDASYWFHAGKILDKPFVISSSNF